MEKFFTACIFVCLSPLLYCVKAIDRPLTSKIANLSPPYYCCDCDGSNNARKFSPILSNINTITNRQITGKNANNHIPDDKYFINSCKIIPIAASCGDNPNTQN